MGTYRVSRLPLRAESRGDCVGVIDPLSSSKTCESDPADLSLELREWKLSLCAVRQLAYEVVREGMFGLWMTVAYSAESMERGMIDELVIMIVWVV
jgi:hypothetical protein